MLLLHKAITPPHRDTRVLHHGSQVHTYVRPLLTRRRLRLCCQYALLDSESAELVRQLVSGTMLSAISTSAISRAQKKLARRAAIDGFVTTAARLFQVNDKDELQDLLAALVLSECVYKKLEMPAEQLGRIISEFTADFPPELVHIEAVQLSLEDVTQNYLVAVGGRSLYVAFMGTKQARDISTDLAFSHEAVWAEQELAGLASEVPSAHRGFLARAKSVPIQQLQALAEGSGRRLVLCGHSLGGAVAKLAGLRLLREAPQWPPPSLRVVCFATPAVGNNALASLVEAAGWGDYFKTYVLPEDQLMRMLRFTQASISPPGSSSSSSDIALASNNSSVSAGSSWSSTPPLLLGRARLSSSSSATAAAGPAVAAGSSSSTAGGSRDTAGSGLGAVVGSMLLRPFARENAKETLRKELRAEEASTMSLDTATMDVESARPAQALANNPSTAAAAAAGPAAAAAAAAAALAAGPRHAVASSSPSLTRRRWGQAIQQQGGWQRQQQSLSQQLTPGDHTCSSDGSSHDVRDVIMTDAVVEAPGGTPAPAAAAAAVAMDDNAAAVKAQQDVADTGNGLPVQNLGLVIQLQRRWMVYQLQQMGRAAMSPLSTARKAVTVFHPFGQYWFISSSGVHGLGDPAYNPDGPLDPQAAAWQEANPGYFSFHRMIAYRTRCMQVIAKISADLAQQGLLLPSAAAARVAAEPGSSSGFGGVQAVRMGGVVPAMRVQSVLARPPLRSPGTLLPLANGALPELGATPGIAAAGGNSNSSSSLMSWYGGGRSNSLSSQDVLAGSPAADPAVAAFDPVVTAAAAAAPGKPPVRRGALAFLPGSRSPKVPEPTVQLTLQVQGCNLHMCRQIGLMAFGEQYRPAFLARAAPGQIPGLTDLTSLTVDHRGQITDLAAAGSSSSYSITAPGSGSSSNGHHDSSSNSWAPLSLLSPVLSRVKQAAVAAAKAVEGERPRWRVPADTAEQLTIQVLLPVSVVDRLTASSSAAAAARSAAGQQQLWPSDEFVLQLKSDFEVLSVPVHLEAHRVGIIGSSAAAATLLAALLSNSGVMQRQYQQRVAAVASTAAAAGSPQTAASGGSVSSMVASQVKQWLPQPQRWISNAQQQQQQQQQQNAAKQLADGMPAQPQQQLALVQQPVQKLKAAASLAAAAGASVAASRLATFSRQFLGRRGPGSVLNPEDEPAAKRMRAAPVIAAGGSRTAAGSSSSRMGSVGASISGSMSSYEDAGGPVYVPGGRISTGIMPTPYSGNGSSSRDAAAAAVRSKQPGPFVPGNMDSCGLQQQQQQEKKGRTAAVRTTPSLPANVSSSIGAITSNNGAGLQLPPRPPPSSSSSSLVSLLGFPAGSSSSWRSQGATAGGAGGGSIRSAGLGGVMYQTLPMRTPLLPVPRGLTGLAKPGSSGNHALPRVLKRASNQLQRQAKTQGSRPGLFGFGQQGIAAALVGWAAAAASSAVSLPVQLMAGSAAAAGAVVTAARGAGSGSAAKHQSSSGSRSGRAGAPAAKKAKAAPAAAHRAAAVPAAAAVAAAAAAAPSPQAKQQHQPWDVLVLAITWDDDFLQLLKHRAVLAELAAAAAAAGVQLVPVLLLEGEETVLSIASADLRGAGLHALAEQAQHAQHDKAKPSQHSSSPVGLLRLEDAAAQLATALHVPSLPLLHLPVRGAVSHFSSSNSSSSRVAASLLGAVGGLEQQRQLLAAVHRLEGRLAGLLQSKHDLAVALPQAQPKL